MPFDERFPYSLGCGILGGDTILGKGKGKENFNPYLRDQSHKRFKHSFSSIRAKMAELEPIENLELLYTSNYIYKHFEHGIGSLVFEIEITIQIDSLYCHLMNVFLTASVVAF